MSEGCVFESRQTKNGWKNIILEAIRTKIDLSCIDLRSISVRFEKVFTIIYIDLVSISVRI